MRKAFATVVLIASVWAGSAHAFSFGVSAARHKQT